MKRTFAGTCVHNPFGSIENLQRIIDSGIKCNREHFFRECEVDDEIKKMIKAFPRDFVFYRTKSGVYFYTWSAIEHFYK